MNFLGKRILVTGSTNGIGHAAAEMFLEAGATVAINGRHADAVAGTIAKFDSERLVSAAGDLRTVDGCKHVVETAVKALGGLDCLVNNVGIGDLSYLMDVTEAHWDSVMNVNLRSAFFCTQFAQAALRDSKGSVIMVSSVAGLIGCPTDMMVYAISKGGMIAMTRAMALELLGDGIRVNCVCPGYTDTPMVRAENEATGGQITRFIDVAVPIQRMATVRETASTILYLASTDAAYCVGTQIIVDGGCTIAASGGGANHASPV